MKIELIPIGKENKISRDSLMYKAKITNIDIFKTELAELKTKHIILFEDGYYRPNTKEEYKNFINKCNTKKTETQELIKIAKREMEEIQDEN